jgi:hypothetical protein
MGNVAALRPLVKEEEMSGIRVLVGTRKAAFILTSDGKRQRWDIHGSLFGAGKSIT